jgi:hypothetical protein
VGDGTASGARADDDDVVANRRHDAAAAPMPLTPA